MVNDWHSFEAAVEPLEWGRAVYTILRLPPDVVEALQRAGARRVEGEIAEHPVNLALTKAPVVDGVFLWAGKSLLERIGIVPGERVEIRLRPAPPDALETPDDVALALRQGEVADAWETLTPGKRRGLLYQINIAKRPDTRAKRIVNLIKALQT